MTSGEKKVLTRGVAAGTLMGVAIGLIIVLIIAMKPELCGAGPVIKRFLQCNPPHPTQAARRPSRRNETGRRGSGRSI